MINIILTGLNGYGGNFIKELLEANDGSHQLVAVVSRNPIKSTHYDKLIEGNIHFYNDIDTCLDKEKVDIAIITTPMHIHYQEIMSALHHNVSIYCEKPLAPTYDECIEIRALASKNNCTVAVGFQWSFSESILSLKKDMINKRFGNMLQMKTVVNWNRPKHYYTESTWKGKQFGTFGEAILENVMSNGTAHYLHNLLFLSGAHIETSATPVTIEGECYRGHDIETFDTTCIRMKTDTNCDLLYLATFLSDKVEVPRFEITFDKGKVYFPDGDDNQILACLNNGEHIRYGSPETNRFGNYKQVIDHILHSSKVSCDIETTLPEVFVSNQVSANIKVIDFPKHLLVETVDGLSVKDLSAVMTSCYEQNQLFSEAGITWATKATTIDL